MNDNKVSSFVLPEQGWRTIAELLTTAEGKSLIEFIESTKAMNWVGYRVRGECDSRLIEVVDLFWALDLIGKRTPVKGDCAAVQMQWRREINFLLILIDRAGPWLSEEEHIDLLSIAVHLRTQCCPRSGNALDWDDLEGVLEEVPNWVRRSRESWQRHRIEEQKERAALKPAD